MINMREPGQIELFDYYQSRMSVVAYKTLSSSYYALFRSVILSVLPAKELSVNFEAVFGAPTKELYSMAGLTLLKEFHNWTAQEAAEAYMFDIRVHFALNLGSDNLSCTSRTVERYLKLIREDDLAIKIFDDVTETLIKELDLKIDQQRLDSTHVFSDMATFSRTKLMGVTVKRFLVQLKRHETESYEALPEALLKRYEKRENALFADVSKSKEKRSSLRQEVAEEMHDLVQRFSGNEKIENMHTYKQLVTIFVQQCEVIDNIKVTEADSPKDKNDESGNNTPESDEKTESDDKSENDGKSENDDSENVVVRAKTGGNVIQNPSDPDATYDGHKGVGYQVQIAETSNPENAVQLVTSILPQTAVESDANALIPVLSDLEKKGILPESMLADTLYGGDENVVNAQEMGVDLVSPVPGPPPKKKSEEPTEKQQRLQKRREEQETEEWRKEYNSRAQIEGTIGSIKRRTSMVRLRYRGKSSVFAAICLKLAGWNISRALKSARIKEKLATITPKYTGKLRNCLPCVSLLFECVFSRRMKAN